VLTKPSFSTGYARNASESANPNLWRGLVGAWMPSFGVTGNKLKDVSGNGNDGTLTNMDPATDWARTNKGLALYFDNSVHKVSYQTNLQSEFKNDFTFSCLVKFNAANDRDVIFGNYNASTGWLNFERHTSNRLRHVYRNGSSVVDDYSPNNSVSAGWNFVNFTRQRISSTQSRLIYHVNSREVRNALVSYPDRTVTWPNFFLGADTRNIFTNLNGNIAFASVHNRALSPAEIKQLYQNPAAPFQKKTVVAGFVPKTFHKVAVLKKPEPSFVNGYARNASESARPHLWKGLVGAWMPSFGVTGNTLRDVVGNANPVSQNALDPVVWESSKIGLVYDFETYSRALGGDVSSKILNGYTFLAYIWRRLTDRREIASQWGAAGAGNASWILQSESGYLRFGNHDGATSLLQSSVPLAYREWQHVAVSWDGRTSGTNAHIYYDGKLVTSGTLTNGVQVSTNYPLEFGTLQGARPWSGKIGCFQAYNRALSPSEIKELFIKPLAPFERKSTVVGAPAPPPPPVTNYKAVKVTKSHIKPSFKTGYARNASESANPNLWKGLVGAWMPSFGVTGETLKDVSGNGNDGTLTNMDAASDWVATSKGLGLEFGVSTYENVSVRTEALSTDAGSFFCWYKRTSVIPNNRDAMIFSGYTSSSVRNFLEVQTYVRLNGQPRVTTGFNSGITGNGVLGPAVYLNQWMHLGYSWSDGEPATLWVNGRLYAQTSNLFVDYGNYSSFKIGNYGFSANLSAGGVIVDAFSYNRALSPSEIKQLYRNPSAPFEMKDTFAAYKEPLPPVKGLFRLP